MITLQINGQTHQFPSPISITELMVALDLVGKRVAVEKNGEIVPRSRHGDVSVTEGDRLEIVVAVGGG